MSQTLSPAVRRLLLDLKEVVQNPLPDVVALPDGDNIFVWQGNVRAAEGDFHSVPVHFKLVFEESYPTKAPFILLYTPVPHPNLTFTSFRNHRDAPWRLSLWDCVPDVNTWRSAFTVHSILVQLQALLLDDELQYDTTKVTKARALELASQLTLTNGHTSATPVPPFPTPDQVQLSTSRRAKMLVSRPCVPPRTLRTQLKLRIHQTIKPTTSSISRRQQQQAATSTAPAIPAASTSTPASSPAGTSQGGPVWQSPPGQPQAAAAAAAAAPAPTPAAGVQEGDDEGWQTVGGRRQPTVEPVFRGRGGRGRGRGGRGGSRRGRGGISTPRHPSSSTPRTPTTNAPRAAPVQPPTPTISLGAFSALAMLQEMGGGQQAPRPQQQHHQQQQASQAAAAVVGLSDEGAQSLSKAAKKNLARNKKRAAARAGSDSAGASSSVPAAATAAAAAPISSAPAAPAAPPTPPSPPASPAAPPAAEAASWVEARPRGAVKAKAAKPQPEEQKSNSPRPVAELISEVLEEATHGATGSEPQAGEGYRGGAFSGVQDLAYLDLGSYLTLLPPDVLASVMCQLAPKELGSLACCNRGLRAVVEDGSVWQRVMARDFPHHEVAASSINEWKHAFLLQANCVLGELKCFHTRQPFTDAVLGLPLQYTTNPRTGVVDYIAADSDLVAVEAVVKGEVSKSLAGDNVQSVLPLFLTAEHFDRALPHLPRVLKQLAPKSIPRGKNLPPPSAWLEVIPRVMNTSVVLLSDHGITVSDRAISTYCALHRLLLALTEHFELWGEAAAILDKFLSTPSQRTKANTPNLGLLLPLLSLSPRHSWVKVAGPMMSETFDRSILWICKHDPSLEALLNVSPSSGEAVPELLEKAFEATVVSRRLMAFHIAFLNTVACPPGTSIEQVMDSYDGLYGRPGEGLLRRMRAKIQRIMDMATWDDYFDAMGLKRRTPAQLTSLLRQAYSNSADKKYHKKGMDFSAVQRSGVSAILLKGQQYTAPPNIKGLEVKSHWSYEPNIGTKWLDMSAVLCGAERSIVEIIDWRDTVSTKTKLRGAVTSSGLAHDDHANCKGMQVMKLDLSGLGTGIQEIFIVGSSWYDMLDIVKQPYVSISDSNGQVEMCQYHLEDYPVRTLRKYRSITFCRLFRKPGNQWGVDAIGHMDEGRASDATNPTNEHGYGPITRFIKGYKPKG